MINLKVIDLAYNNLGGELPQCWGNLSSLLVMDLRFNQFSGSLPATFTKADKLRGIHLNGNRLQGPLPRALINCRNLEVLDLGNNNISDVFPSWIGMLPQLHALVLRSNRFYGNVFVSESRHFSSKLQIIDLSDNVLTGPLPSDFFKKLDAMVYVDENNVPMQRLNDGLFDGNFVQIVYKGEEGMLVRILIMYTSIGFSNNKFEGEIPSSITMLHSLRFLNLSHNYLTGHIPAFLANLRVLESLDLSSNELTGQIPSQLTALTFLAVLNLSQNHLDGAIPQGKQFDTFENSSYEGDVGLCGLPLSKKCREEEATVALQQEDDLSFFDGFTWESVLIGYGGGMLLGLVIGYHIVFSEEPNWFHRIFKVLTWIKKKER